jgi:hypothetical protein
MTGLFMVIGGILGGWLGWLLDRKAARDKAASGIQASEEYTPNT